MGLRRCLAALLATLLPLTVYAAVPAAAEELPEPGTVVASAPLPSSHWVPGATGQAWELTYVTTDTFGERALSTGAVFLPTGSPPEGGWPVVSWAHGTVGIADECAPSRHPRSARDAAYLRTWMEQGYAVVASDYVGQGTPGLSTYLDGRATAHSIVDIVKAGHELTGALSPEWVTIGQSQGAAGSIYAARHATAFGGPGLDYRGAVGTGTPAYIESYVMGLGPFVPPTLPSGTAGFLGYILAGLRYAHPELGIDSVLTAKGKLALTQAETLCMDAYAAALTGNPIGGWFSRNLSSLPGFNATVRDYMAMPVSGFDRPFFLGHGLLDVTVPSPLTVLYAAHLALRGEPVTFRTYVSDHSGTMAASLPDTVPYVAALFAD